MDCDIAEYNNNGLGELCKNWQLVWVVWDWVEKLFLSQSWLYLSMCCPWSPSSNQHSSIPLPFSPF